ncbi:hypothetical protein D3C71_2018750 [compost metagenome]
MEMMTASECLPKLKATVSNYGLNGQLVGVIDATHLGIRVAMLYGRTRDNGSANSFVHPTLCI